MAFGNDSLPSQNWQFGLGDPIVNADMVHDQVWRGHIFNNEMVSVFRVKYDDTDAKLQEISPELAELCANKLAAADALQEARDEIGAENARQRRRTETEEQRATIKELIRLSNAAAAAYATCKSQTFKQPGVKEALADIDETCRVSTNARYGESEAFWGTKLAMQNAVRRVKGRPNMKYWDGDGRIAVQLDAKSLTGTLLNGTNTRVQLLELTPETLERVLSEKRRAREKEEACGSWVKTPRCVPAGTTHLLNFRPQK